VVSPRWLELSVGGGLFGLFLVWWLVGFSQYRTLETPPADAMPVYATAKQWMWEFAYPAGPTSTDVLVVPVGRPVKVILSARDVLHGFYVPQFRIKQDAIPGHATFAWFTAEQPGSYDILCTQYCGTRHSLMRGQVVALAPADFSRWLAAASTTGKGDGAGLAEQGHALAAAHGCLRCHTTDGTRFIGPTWARAYGSTRSLANGAQVVVDEAYLTESMMDPNAKLAAGYAAVMPSYQGVLDPAQIGAIVEYIRSLRDAQPVPDPAPTGPVHD
jgi:cytochrome c oxidase subunit 2